MMSHKVTFHVTRSSSQKNIDDTTNSDEKLLCICQQPNDDSIFMIRCGKCNEWYHGTCMEIDEDHADTIDVYHCPTCEIKYGPSIYYDDKEGNRNKKIKDNDDQNRNNVDPKKDDAIEIEQKEIER